jgi:8-oxo-dGTP pyrophosphatase MutT (NUDIX family)
MSKITSCGVIITDGKKLLAIKPYGKPHSLDIPKGKKELGETDAQTASRELFEETSIRIPPESLRYLGTFYYMVNKDLSLFVYKSSSLPPLSSLACSSYFTNDYGKRVPEAVGFTYTTFDNPHFYRTLQPILQKLKKSI